jgi:hypothetical protein
MKTKHVLNLIKIITESYKERLVKLYGYSKVSQISDGPKMSKYGIYTFEFFFSLYVFIQFFFFRPNKAKYVFVNSKYNDIICALNKKDVLVMGGMTRDLLFCLKNRVGFIWIGYLVKAFDIHYYYGRSGSYIKALTLLERIVVGNNNQKSILLWEDDIAVGLSFAHLFNKNKLVDVIYIQHGLLVFGESIDPPGTNSNYNFIIKDSQRKFLKDSNDKNCCVIGVTYDVFAEPSFKKNIYLVGIGGLGTDDPIYLYSLWMYSKIFGEFIGSGYKVFYRPHPIENLDFCRKCFPNIDTTSPKDLFSSSVSTYIGFQSTFLYEARYFGNVTIGITSVEMSQQSKDFNTDLKIDEDDIQHIVRELNLYIENNDNTPLNKGSIKERFTKCMNIINSNATS